MWLWSLSPPLLLLEQLTLTASADNGWLNCRSTVRPGPEFTRLIGIIAARLVIFIAFTLCKWASNRHLLLLIVVTWNWDGYCQPNPSRFLTCGTKGNAAVSFHLPQTKPQKDGHESTIGSWNLEGRGIWPWESHWRGQRCPLPKWLLISDARR